LGNGTDVLAILDIERGIYGLIIEIFELVIATPDISLAIQKIG